MSWGELDLKAGTFTLPAVRSKNRREWKFPLSRQAVKLLRGIPRHTGPYVFTTGDGTKHFQGYSGTKNREGQIGKLRKAAGVDFMLKDLRSTMASGMTATLGIRIDTVRDCLNHKRRGTAELHYIARADVDAMRKAFQRWADHAGRIVKGEAGKVVPFKTQTG